MRLMLALSRIRPSLGKFLATSLVGHGMDMTLSGPGPDLAEPRTRLTLGYLALSDFWSQLAIALVSE